MSANPEITVESPIEEQQNGDEVHDSEEIEDAPQETTNEDEEFLNEELLDGEPMPEEGVGEDGAPDAPLPELTEVPLPTASRNALEFIAEFDRKLWQFICFQDHVATSTDSGKVLGDCKIAVHPVWAYDRDCFKVTAASKGVVDNINCGTTLTCHVDKDLGTLHQRHEEFIQYADGTLRRITEITTGDDDMTISSRMEHADKLITKREATYTREEMSGFISEGANLLLQRLMVRRDIPEEFRVISLDSNATPCPAVYEKLAERQQMVGQKKVYVTGVSRQLESEGEMPTTWHSYFLSDGHLALRVQTGSALQLRLLRVPAYISEDEKHEKPTFEQVDLKWEEDLQLRSIFERRKGELKDNYDTYLRNHGDANALMADFLQALLLDKPENVLSFAAGHFKLFDPSRIPLAPFAKTSRVAPFTESTANAEIMNRVQHTFV